MLALNRSEIEESRSSRRQPLDDEDADRLLAAAKTVVIARGRGRRRIAAGDATRDDLRGPTGNYRAPMLLVGTTLVVGLHLETLGELGLR